MFHGSCRRSVPVPVFINLSSHHLSSSLWQAYPEYSRFVINTAPLQFKNALVQLETKHGKVGDHSGLPGFVRHVKAPTLKRGKELE